MIFKVMHDFPSSGVYCMTFWYYVTFSCEVLRALLPHSKLKHICRYFFAMLYRLSYAVWMYKYSSAVFE